jgi:hypothetical protein
MISAYPNNILQMKNLRLFLFISLSIALASCKKDDPSDVIIDDVSPTPPQLALSYKFDVNGSVFNINNSYRISDSLFVKFETVQFYLSNISLLKENGFSKSVNDVVLFKTSNNNANLGDFPSGVYSGLKFSFGIDYLRNHADPSQYNASPNHPLALQNPSMHWSWDQGYIFAIIDGKYSTDSLTESNLGSNFSYHIAKDENYKDSVSRAFPSSILVNANQTSEVKLKINLANIFSGLSMSLDNSTTSTVNPVLARQVRDNLIDAISLD